MDIIIVIFIVFFAVSGMTVAKVFINRRKRRYESKKEEERAQKEQEKLAEKATEQRLRKEGEKESLRKEEERLEKIKAEEEKIDKGIREKASKEKKERAQLKSEEKESKEEKEAKAKNADEEKASSEKESSREQLPPNKRGGRPRGSTKNIQTQQQLERELRPLKPDIVCWNKGWEWIVGIEVPEEFESSRVTQNDEVLEQDTSDATLYPLRHLKGRIKVTFTTGEQDREIDISIMEKRRDYLIFKMRKNWKGLGRLVKRPTKGYYLIIVPQGWKRDEDKSGSAPVPPENVQINGYKAHFFVLRGNENTAIAFIDTNGELIQVELGSSRFQLLGKEIPDTTDDMGPLFGEEPPRIKKIDEQEWSNVGVVVVGEEGSGINRWRTQFVPQESAKEQRMPDELVNRRGGWYFVRVYDKNDDLLESMDFRFIAGLKGIQIMNSECLPKPTGYENVIVQFTHQSNCKVEPADEEMRHALEIRRENDFTIITIPSRADYDKTHWILSEGNAKVKVTVLVERVWWCVGPLGVVPANWTDRTVCLSRTDFTAITDKALWVKFPCNRWINKIEVGFNRTKSRYYIVEVEKDVMAVPLRDFCDAEEIENKQEEFTMKIWVSPKETKTYEAIVLKIPAELSATAKPSTLPKQPTPTPPPAKPSLPLKPEAVVKGRRGKRKGKGFSRSEIYSAGLTMGDVKRSHMPYDKRRKSSHLWNIERLKYITER